MISAEILTIGDEILYGQITDTNSAWIGSQLASLGVRVVRKTSVGDVWEEMLAAFAEAQTRADIVLVTGGLGPTKDDITKKALAHYYSCEIMEDAAALADLENYFSLRSRTLNELNKLQATLPTAAERVPNDRGTASGMWFWKDGKALVSMPGVPAEMKHMMTNYVLPKLKNSFATENIIHAFLCTVGIAESELALKIEDWESKLPSFIRLAYLPQRGQVKLRLSASGADEELMRKALSEHQAAGLALLGKLVFATEGMSLEQCVFNLLGEKSATISAVESCTGGAFVSRLTMMPGMSAHLVGSSVAYSQAAKEQIGVPASIIKEHGIVSAATAEAMAKAGQTYFCTDFCLASTGYAGPAAATDSLPVGTIFIAIAGDGFVVSKELRLTPNREINIELAATNMLNMLRLQLLA